MKILAGAQIAEEMHGDRTEGIMARIEARAGTVDIDAQRLILRATGFQFLPIAGGEQHAVAIEDVAARDLARDGVDAWVVLGAFYAVVFEDAGVAREIFAVVQNLVTRGEGNQNEGACGQGRAGPAHGWAEERVRFGRGIAHRDGQQQREDEEVRQHGGISGA